MKIIEKLDENFENNLYKTYTSRGILDYNFSLEEHSVKIVLDENKKIIIDNVIFTSCSLGIAFDGVSFLDIYFDFYSDIKDCYSLLINSGYGFVGETEKAKNVYHLQLNGDVYGDIFSLSAPKIVSE